MAKDKKLISRRDFIKGAAAGVVSMAALSVVDIAANLSKGEKGSSEAQLPQGQTADRPHREPALHIHPVLILQAPRASARMLP